MAFEITGIIIIFLITVLLGIPLGRYLGKIVLGEKTIFEFLAPLERWIFKICGIDPNREMNWKQHLMALLSINLVWFLFSMLVLMNMSWLPLNPDHNPSMSADLAFNTTTSFISNTNMQDYSGESAMSYLGQLTLMFFQFVSAAVGIAICFAAFNALREKTASKMGNFYNYLLKTCTRVLLPLSIIVAIILAVNGMPQTFLGKDTQMSLQGDTMHISRGPVAAMIAIKQLGTNGGGFFGANSAAPFENPSYITNVVENVSIFLIPIAMIFALGYVLKRRKLSWVIFGVMTFGVLVFLIPTIYFELHGNPAISHMGIQQAMGNMEGKEVRLGSAASAFWGITTTVTSNGSVNSMHDSFMPLSGMFAMLGMMINAFYGGVGVGFLNFFVYMVIAVFISGLMVGRTPELLGKKIEAKEMKIATIIALLHPFLILTGTALASHLYAIDPKAYSGWLGNPGYHGFSEMLYQYTSASANNGSGFAGLSANVPFWNITTGIVMLLARYLPIIGPLAIAGILASKKYIPESAGTLKIDTGTFGLMTYAVMIIISALAFFPALALGPIAEYFSMN